MKRMQANRRQRLDILDAAVSIDPLFAVVLMQARAAARERVRQRQALEMQSPKPVDPDLAFMLENDSIGGC